MEWVGLLTELSEYDHDSPFLMTEALRCQLIQWKTINAAERGD